MLHDIFEINKDNFLSPICDIMTSTNVNMFINGIEEYCKLIDNYIYTLDNKNSDIIINRINTRKLYKVVGELRFIKREEALKTAERLRQYYKDDNNIYITMDYLNFSMKDKNPMDNIIFYEYNDSNNNYEIRKVDSKQYILAVENFEEILVRIYTKDITKREQYNEELLYF
jgi:hypothetical protein